MEQKNKMEQKILEIINTVLQNRAKGSITELESGLKLRDDLGMDSLDLAELTVRIEAEYDIDIFEDGLILTVEEILNKLSHK